MELNGAFGRLEVYNAAKGRWTCAMDPGSFKSRVSVKPKNFIVINQKGIDPPSLEILARNNIVGIRRAKRRNGERIPLACGGKCLNSVDDVEESDLGFAKLVYEQSLGEDKYTFIEGVENPFSCTILIKGIVHER